MDVEHDPFTLDPDEVRDLGFGETVARNERKRLLNHDGTFSSGRYGESLLRSVPIYEHLTAISWRKFYLLTLVAYLAISLFFATVYFALGPDTIAGLVGSSELDRFAQSFFFSVHTVTTVGYGSLSPATTAANFVVALEALVGMAGFALLAALLFARLSRPVADIRFSGDAIVAPFRDMTGLMFRIVNGSRGELADVSVRVIFSWLDGQGEDRRRRFETLELERTHVTFFPLTWTVVHPIDGHSPLQGWDAARMAAAHAEILIQVAGFAEVYSQIVRARTSYVAEEVQFGARFTSILEETESGGGQVDIRRIGEVERIG
jgi:inward rectifier potassium channel